MISCQRAAPVWTAKMRGVFHTNGIYGKFISAGMRKKLIYLLFPLFLLNTGNLCPFQKSTEEINQEKLKNILTKTAEYCEKLKKMALYFVCHENIEEKIYFYTKTKAFVSEDYAASTPLAKVNLKQRRMKRKTYIYDYQMVKKGDKQEEKRVLLKENRKEKRVENANLKIQGYKAKFLVYGPVGFLSYYWQNHFSYEITGRDEINGIRTIVISASPMQPREENYYFGKIWINENDFSILKIEWDARSLEGYEKKISSGVTKNLSWEVFFEVEKNGVRFPSRQIIKDIYLTEAGKQHPRCLTTFVYDNYKFFTVETEVKFDKGAN
jgi:hypothetical protein